MPTEITPQNFEKFVQERKYLHNVSPRTEQIYRAAWQKWQKYGPDPVDFVAGMRDGGMNATGSNIYISKARPQAGSRQTAASGRRQQAA
jgi:hypothetical protein